MIKIAKDCLLRRLGILQERTGRSVLVLAAQTSQDMVLHSVSDSSFSLEASEPE